MAGLIGQAGGGAPPQGMPQGGPPEGPPGGPPGAEGGPVGGKGGDPATKAQMLLIYQPLKMLYQPQSVKHIVEAATRGDPAKVLASASVSSVMASAKAGLEAGAPIKEEMFGPAVVEVIKGLGGLIASSKAFDPDDIPGIVNGAIQFAAQLGGGGGEGEQPPQGPEGATPGPGGAGMPPGMAGGPPRQPQQPMGV